jgi:hypothetical protein
MPSVFTALVASTALCGFVALSQRFVRRCQPTGSAWSEICALLRGCAPSVYQRSMFIFISPFTISCESGADLVPEMPDGSVVWTQWEGQ